MVGEKHSTADMKRLIVMPLSLMVNVRQMFPRTGREKLNALFSQSVIFVYNHNLLQILCLSGFIRTALTICRFRFVTFLMVVSIDDSQKASYIENNTLYSLCAPYLTHA